MTQVSQRARAIAPTLIRTITSRARESSIHLGIGQPDLEVSSCALDAAAKYLQTRRAPYTANAGLDEARAAVATHYGLESHLEVMLTVGVQEALAVAFLGLVNPQDEVLLPAPGFPAYDNLVRAAGGIPVHYQLIPETWQPDLDDFMAKLSARTAAVLLNSPSNPTGVCIGADRVAQIVQACEERGITWISDEIYEDITYETNHASARSFGTQGLVCSGLSKSHAAMGWRMGWMTGPRELISALTPLHQHLVTSAPIFSQHALIGALSGHDGHVNEVVEDFSQRRALLLKGLRAIPNTSFVEPDGAFYVFWDVSHYSEKLGSTLNLALKILEDVDVVTIPGEGFGQAGQGYLRLAYTRPLAELAEASSRLSQFFAQL